MNNQAIKTALNRVTPLFNRVLVRQIERRKTTNGGIVLPDDTKVRILEGTVVSVGPGNVNDNGVHVPVSVQPGDHVILPDYGGTKLYLDGGRENEVLYLYRESEILAKINDY